MGDDPLSKASEQWYNTHQKERETLFSNESFAIGVFQAVSGGALLAGLSQWSSLISLAGAIPFLAFISLMGLGLACAVFAAYSRHQYKMWDVKARVSASDSEATARSKLSSFYLRSMRIAMFAALATFCVGLGVLLVASWISVLGSKQTGSAPVPPHLPPSTSKSVPNAASSPDTPHSPPHAPAQPH